MCLGILGKKVFRLHYLFIYLLLFFGKHFVGDGDSAQAARWARIPGRVPRSSPSRWRKRERKKKNNNVFFFLFKIKENNRERDEKRGEGREGGGKNVPALRFQSHKFRSIGRFSFSHAPAAPIQQGFCCVSIIFIAIIVMEGSLVLHDMFSTSSSSSSIDPVWCSKVKLYNDASFKIREKKLRNALN